MVFIETMINALVSEEEASFDMFDDFLDVLQFDEVAWLFGTILALPKSAKVSEIKQIISSRKLPAKYGPQQSLLKEVMLKNSDAFADLGVVMTRAFINKFFRLAILPLVLQQVDKMDEAAGEMLEELINYKTLDQDDKAMRAMYKDACEKSIALLESKISSKNWTQINVLAKTIMVCAASARP